MPPSEHTSSIPDHPPVAHWSEQCSYKALVGGSIPPWRTKHQTQLIIMDNKLAEKYLSEALEGAEQAKEQIENAVGQMKAQLKNAEAQQSSVAEAIVDLKQLLGLEDEDVTEEA